MGSELVRGRGIRSETLGLGWRCSTSTVLQQGVREGPGCSRND